jgi:hypothetical protein
MMRRTGFFIVIVLIAFAKPTFARYYDPANGRFLQEDPAPSSNLYPYVDNNPTNKIDPFGQWGRDVHYVETLNIAMTMGFSFADSKQIAEWDVYQDRVWTLGGAEHFDKDPSSADSRIQMSRDYLENAVTYMNMGNKDLAIQALGMGLHPLQDSFAHTMGPLAHLLQENPKGSKPDSVSKHPKAFRLTQVATYLYLLEFQIRTARPKQCK